MSHTPGPWVVGERKGCHTPIDSDSWFGLAKVVTRMGGSRKDEPTGVANARLIAAAPELLEALEALVACITETRGPNANDAVTAARTVIAKAKGELCIA